MKEKKPSKESLPKVGKKEIADLAPSKSGGSKVVGGAIRRGDEPELIP